MPLLQNWIHKLEEGSGFRHVRIGLGCLAVLMLFVGYNFRAFRNLNTIEAMDAAQVARNVSEGRGFTTHFIRPFSIHLVKKHNDAKAGAIPLDERPDHARLKSMHPDLANPPAYPAALAAWMKVYKIGLKGLNGVRNAMPVFIKSRLPEFNESIANPLWQRDGRFWWHPEDFFIAVFNQLILFCIVVLVFFLARRLFDATVAWTSAVLLLGCELLWRFSVSGLPTMFLMLIFTLLAWCLVRIEEEVREPKGHDRRLFIFAALAGLLTGAGMLTRYSFGAVILLVLAFLILFGGTRRVVLCLAAVAAFLIVVSPWIYRNYSVSGTPFGISGYSVIESTVFFPEHKLERSLHPEFQGMSLRGFAYKFLPNVREILQNDLPTLGGTWITAFFLVGLMLTFRNFAIKRLRYFLLASLMLFAIAQALIRTQISEESPRVNGENLLILVLPLVTVFGVSLFYTLLDQIPLMLPKLRYAIIGAFGVIVCLPMFFTFLPPRQSPISYPPYNPPVIYLTSDWMRENEMMMSDVPWAVAWYGERQCLWLTLNAKDDFYEVNDFIKPVRALYLTQQTMDSRFLSEWVKPGEQTWGNLILQTLVSRQVPSAFPLRVLAGRFLPDQMFLTDWERWNRPGE